MELANKNILVTGAEGFVGTALVYALVKKKARVISLSRKKSSHVLEHPQIKRYYGTVVQMRDVDQLVKKTNSEIIYHLAAQSLVEEGHLSPIHTFEVNVRGAWNVLEAARVNHVQKVIIASSVHVYGDNPNVPFHEQYFPQPSRPYETSKACADLLAQSYADTYNVPIEIPRFSNIYGPGDCNFNRIIPKIMMALALDKNPDLWDIGAVRDFLYIDDAINAYVLLAEKELPAIKRGRIFNIGSGAPIGIVELANKIISLTKTDKKLILHSSPEFREKEIIKQYVSINKAKKLLGWKPKVKLEEGLISTYNWYLKNFSLNVIH